MYEIKGDPNVKLFSSLTYKYGKVESEQGVGKSVESMLPRVLV